MIAMASPHRDPETQRLLDRALDDQKSSWTRGEPEPVEGFLARDPALGRDIEAILDLIYHEYVLRRDRGEDPDPNEFFARFPDHAETLLLQLGMDAAIASTTRSSTGDDRKEKDAREPIETIGGYEIIARLGRGGMGIVYKARDLKLDRIVAIKTIAEGRHPAPDQLGRFHSEAHAVARLSHPNIITIHAVGEHDDRPYLCLEFADDGSLAQRLAEKPMAPREAAALVETLARAVHAAHQAGVVHRDLKPSNVLLTSGGVPKVSDFGLAKLLDADSGHTVTGQPIGTPSYMAPEQAEGSPKRVGPAADTYALGAILYQALTGRPPFLGESTMETLKLVTSAEVAAPHLLRPDVPRDLETICLKCLDKTPLGRYATALDLAEDLRRFQRGEPILARRIGSFRRFSKWTRRHPWQTTSAATVLIAASAFIGFISWHEAQLRVEVKRTEAKADEARRNYQEARSTIQKMLARFGESRFDGTPRMKELGATQIEDALAFYENILHRDTAHDPAIRFDTAAALGTLSTTQIGNADRAERLVRRALELIEGLRAEFPENTEYLGLQVMGFLRLGVYLDALGRAEEAVAASQESARLSEILARATPDNLSHQELVATCHDSYASRLRLLHRFRDARDHYGKAIAIRSQLDPVQFVGLTQRQTDTLVNDGVTLWNMGDYSRAEARFQEIEEFVKAVPAEQRGGLIVGRLYLNWSGLLTDSKRFDEAIDRARAGLDLVEPLLRLEPNDPEARDTCLKLNGNRALALSGKGRHRESAEAWDRVIALAPDPAPPGYRIQRALELARVNEVALALSQSLLAQLASVSSFEDRYNLGCLYSLCAAAVRDDPNVPLDERKRLVASYIAEALGWLKSVADAGFFRDPANRENARQDPDLAIFRDREEFRRLVGPDASGSTVTSGHR